MDLSIITATRGRPALLWQCCEHVRRQSCEGVIIEHIVVSDGADEESRRVAGMFGSRYFETAGGATDDGNRGRDVGIREARGRYVAFWDDDNVYYPHSAAAQYASVYGVGIGLTAVHHRQLRKVIPELPFTRPRLGNVDTACLCVDRTLARTTTWVDGDNGRCGDWRWLERLLPRVDEFGGLRFVSVITASHL